MSALASWEHLAVVALAEFQAAVAAELAVSARLRAVRALKQDDEQLQREYRAASLVTFAAFAKWKASVRP